MKATLVALVSFTLLALCGGCEARSSVDAAQTAIVTVQTVVPGAQATAQAGATLVSNVVSTGQPVLLALQGLLQGTNVQLNTAPAGASGSDVTEVSIQATDSQGALAQVDPTTRQRAAAAAIQAVQGYYPNASVSLKVTDPNGETVISGTAQPRQSPSVQ